MNYIIKELIELKRESQWLWLSLKFCFFSGNMLKASGHWQTQYFILSNAFHLSFAKDTMSLRLSHYPESPGATLVDTSRFETSVSWTSLNLILSFLDISEPSFVLFYSLTPCYTFHCAPFIASFLWLLAMNEDFSLLVQIQSFSTLTHSLRSAALWSAARYQLRPDAGEMLGMNATSVNSGFVGVHLCRHRPKFPFLLLLWGEFSTSWLLCFSLGRVVFQTVLPIYTYLCTYRYIFVYIHICMWTACSDSFGVNAANILFSKLQVWLFAICKENVMTLFNKTRKNFQAGPKILGSDPGQYQMLQRKM